MFKLSIVTPEKIFYESQVKSLIVPGTEGYLGVLSNHAPLITALKPGKIEFTDADDDEHIIAVSGGFLEVSGNVATLLADSAEDSGDIDIERARKAYERERERFLAIARGDEEGEMKAAREAMERSKNRIKVYEDTH